MHLFENLLTLCLIFVWEFSVYIRKHKIESMHEPTELLKLIIGKEDDKELGLEFIKAFSTCFKKKCNDNSIIATGISCSLFLSSIILGLPTNILHTYVRNIREKYPFLAFNCNKYEELYNTIEKEPLLLIDKNLNYHKIEISKKDIFEAFDFVTNG